MATLYQLTLKCFAGYLLVVAVLLCLSSLSRGQVTYITDVLGGDGLKNVVTVNATAASTVTISDEVTLLEITGDFTLNPDTATRWSTNKWCEFTLILSDAGYAGRSITWSASFNATDLAALDIDELTVLECWKAPTAVNGTHEWHVAQIQKENP